MINKLKPRVLIYDKKCKKCNIIKNTSEFYIEINKKRKYTRFRSYCKSCENLIRSNKRKNDDNFRLRENARSKKWSLDNPERSKNGIRNATLKLKYGIGIKEYQLLFKKQHGKCAICETINSGGRENKSFHIDHNHITGQIRGLLCWSCNTSLGKFNDDPKLLMKASEYLLKNYE